MKLDGVLESCLYVDDLPRARAFYEDVCGLQAMIGDDRFCALEVGGKQVLLLFLKGGSTEPMQIPGGMIPPHDGSGQMHMAFSIPAGELAAWEQRLTEKGVEIESRVNWPRGGTSIYFRDPDQNCLELVTPGCWRIY